MLAVLGPTASGKSDLALHLAARSGGEIVSVDSMQVYRGMDIGTAKPDLATRHRLPHHLIDIADPAEEMTVADFQRLGRSALSDLAGRGTMAVIVGGSGLHFRALVDPMTFAPTDPELRRALERRRLDELRPELLAVDPAAGGSVDLANKRRVVRALEVLHLTGVSPSGRAATSEHRALDAYEPEVPHVSIGIDPGDRLAERVAARFDAMIEAGLLDEVAGLAGRLGRTAAQAVGYKQLVPVVSGRSGLVEARDEAIRATMALAKRQRTFFRRDPRIRWITWHDDPARRVDRATAAVEEASWTS